MSLKKFNCEKAGSRLRLIVNDKGEIIMLLCNNRLVVIISLELVEREKSDAENLYRMHSIDGSDPFQWSKCIFS